MNQTFSKFISEKEIACIFKYMQSHLKNANNQNIKYFFKTSRYTITIFNNKKILVQGEGYDWILRLLKTDSHLNKDENLKQKFTKEYIGSDESGTGDFFGGISVAAAYAPEINYLKIEKLGVKDSKLMDDRQIWLIIDDLKKLCSYEVISLSAKEYNEMYKIYPNIKKILALLHIDVIEKLALRTEIKNAVIDQFVTKSVFLNYMKNEKKIISLNLSFETKGESKFLNIAIASIFARWSFLKSIENIQKNTNHKIKLGCDYMVEEIAKKIFLKNEANEFVKTHFKTLKKINVK